MDETRGKLDVRAIALRVAQIAALVVSGVVLFVTVGNVDAGHAATARQHEENQVEMRRISSEIAAQGELPVVSDDSVSDLVGAAKSRGDEVATMETLMHTASESTDDVATIQSRADYVGERLSEASQSMRVTWAAGITDDISWTFCAPTQFDGETLKCVWLGTSVADGTLMSYVTGTYVPDDDVFDGVTSWMTYEGQQRLGFTLDSEEAQPAEDDSDADVEPVDVEEGETDE